MLKKFLKENIKSGIDELLFPSFFTCEICNAEIEEGKIFCESCKKDVRFNNKTVCKKCGREIHDGTYCKSCKITQYDFEKAASAFVYEEPIRSLILKFKNKNKRYLKKVFAIYLSYLYAKSDFVADYITFVPITKKAKRQRGYNQSQLLAEELSKILGIPIIFALEKIRETIRQEGLTYAERIKNPEGAFTCNADLRGKRILLVDDVFTTGATSNACAKALRRGKALSVYVFTVASTKDINFKNE